MNQKTKLVVSTAANLTHLHRSGGSDAGIDNALKSSLLDLFVTACSQIH